MNIAYLACGETLPGAENRRVDAFEHDQMMAAFASALLRNTDNIVEVAWDEDTDWAQYDACLIGTTWDYCDRYEEFLATLKRINQLAPVFNSPDMVAWNAHKGYLRELNKKGINTIPTVWIDDQLASVDWQSLHKILSSETLVIKRQVGANADGQFKKGIVESAPKLSHPVMVQPYLKAIADEGEYSFIFIDGEFSHALLKKPSKGDYRIQSSYGGTEAAIKPEKKDLRMATAVLEVLDDTPLYARVDMVRDSEGILSLMELELIEPFLYPLQGPNLGKMILAAIGKRI